ncbi:MAG: hypothetical protein ABID38_03100 [Candidatus Diapherotrites archaeon]
MLMETLYNAMNLNLGWFVELILGNLFFSFGFLAMMYYFFEGKKLLRTTALITLILFAVPDFEKVTGFVIIVPAFLAIHYIAKLAVLKFAETVPGLEKWMMVVNNLELILAFFFFNLFLA